MILEQKTITTIVADEGKTLRRISDGHEVGERLTLGYNYYEAGLPLAEPHLETPSDYEEIDAPVQNEEEPIVVSHESEIHKLKLASRIIKQYKDSINDLGLSDEEALEVKEWFPEFKEGETLYEGQRILYNGKLYKVLQEHTVMPLIYPDEEGASNLYRAI